MLKQINPIKVISASSMAVATGPASPALPCNAPAPLTTDKAPSLTDREADYVLPARVFVNWKADGEPRAIMRPLTEREQSVIEHRRDELQPALSAYLDEERAAVEAEIMALFAGRRSMRQSGVEAEATAAITARVLRQFPLWAISEGCMVIARGGGDVDHRYAPNDSEIYAVVEKVVRPYREKLENANALLSAPVEPPRAIAEPVRDQTRVDDLVADARAKHGIPQDGLPPKPMQPEQLPPSDGKHSLRVQADLAGRRGREARP